MIKSNIKREFSCDIEKLWNIITDNTVPTICTYPNIFSTFSCAFFGVFAFRFVTNSFSSYRGKHTFRQSQENCLPSRGPASDAPSRQLPYALPIGDGIR